MTGLKTNTKLFEQQKTKMKIASPIWQKLNMVCHRVLSLGHYFFFCISMIYLSLTSQLDSILFADDAFLAMSF